MKISLGADHAGYQLKEKLKQRLAGQGIEVTDRGTTSIDSVDYPDYAREVARDVACKRADWGILVCGSGVGMAMAANKVPGIRAALCYDKASARNSREHNNANVLTLGGRLLTMTQAEEVLRVWLETPFAGGRHAARVDKITEIEKRFATWTRKS